VKSVAGLQTHVIADSWGDINASVFAAWRLAFKHVSPVIGHPGTTVFPLGVAYLWAIIELDPAALADRFSGAGAITVKPRNDTRGLWAMEAMIQAVVVWQGDVK
jgi:hypothetical protein